VVELGLKVITDVNEFDRIRAAWDSFVASMGTNWYLLGGFIRIQMVRSRRQRGTPIVVLRLAEGSVVGVCAFEMRQRYGLRFARFLLPADYSPDFLVTPEHRQSFVAASLELLLERMKCQAVELIFPKGSPQEAASNTYCEGKGLRPFVKDAGKHSVLPVDGAWREFEGRRGSNFRNHFKKVEAKLTERGPWRLLQDRANSLESIDRITTIERHSWKHRGRREQRPDLAGLDPTLLAYTMYNGPGLMDALCPQAWFLELQETPIAYAIVVEINGVAYLAKTSYDDRYHDLYPGEYVQNAAIRSLFDSKLVYRLDFMTFLRYHKRWTYSLEKREAMRISQGVFALANTRAFVGGLPLARKIGTKLLPNLRLGLG
jgi:hypothetical protein